MASLRTRPPLERAKEIIFEEVCVADRRFRRDWKGGERRLGLLVWVCGSGGSARGVAEEWQRSGRGRQAGEDGSDTISG